MKKILLPSFLLASLLLSLNAQPWPGGARWVYHQEKFLPSPEETYLVLKKTGDTLLQGRACSRIQESHVNVAPNGGTTTYTGYTHILWADGLRMEVFDPFAQAFFPLYDLDKKAGDTLDSYCIFTSQTMRLVVDSVGTALEGTQPLKIVWAHSPEPGNCYLYGPIVERLGWNQYFFPRPGFVDPPPGGFLICYEDEQMKFPENVHCPAFWVGESEPKGEESPLLYPNPTRSGKVYWHGGGHVSRLRVFDAHGRLIQTVDDPATAEQAISLETWPDGLYFVEMHTQNQIVVKKVLKSP